MRLFQAGKVKFIAREMADVVDDDSTVKVEQLLLSISECFVYKIPPLAAAGGYR